jgi:hypothetical protein
MSMIFHLYTTVCSTVILCSGSAVHNTVLLIVLFFVKLMNHECTWTKHDDTPITSKGKNGRLHTQSDRQNV